MPFVRITTTTDVPAAQRDELLAVVSRAAAEATGKPERYMMVLLDTGAVMLGGQGGPGAFVDVRAIGGLTPAVNANLSASLCAAIEQGLKVPKDRVYLTFTEFPATNWGHNGRTFG
jgi:phenylpyruvate tautomerase